MENCNCRNQSGLCPACTEVICQQLMEAPATVRRLKVWLAVKRVPAKVRAQWQRELAVAEYLATP